MCATNNKNCLFGYLCAMAKGMESEIYMVHDFMKLTFLSGNKNSNNN